MLSTALLLENDDITRYTILGGNIDVNKIYPAVLSCQHLRIKPILGKELYNKLCEDYFNDVLVGPYIELREELLQMVVHGSCEYYISQGAYRLDNGGMYRHKPENSENITKVDVDYVVQASRKMYDQAEREFLRWFKLNSSNFPEYEQTCKTSRVNIGGWSLSKRGCNNC